MMSNRVTNMRDGNVDAACRKSQTYPSSREAPRLACRWQKDTDGALVMAWSLGDAEAHALYSLNGQADSQPPKRVAYDFVYRPQPTNRVKSVAEGIAIAVLLCIGIYVTFMGFFIEHSDLL
jgi:hypothetical protein